MKHTSCTHHIMANSITSNSITCNKIKSHRTTSSPIPHRKMPHLSKSYTTTLLPTASCTTTSHNKNVLNNITSDDVTFNYVWPNWITLRIIKQQNITLLLHQPPVSSVARDADARQIHSPVYRGFPADRVDLVLLVVPVKEWRLSQTQHEMLVPR